MDAVKVQCQKYFVQLIKFCFQQFFNEFHLVLDALIKNSKVNNTELLRIM